MMKFIQLILFAFICLTLSSCKEKSKSDVEKEYLSSIIQHYSFPKSTEWVVILPGLGCHGCIQEGETFMKNNADLKNTAFILTRIESIKILSQKTGVKISEHQNIIVDSDNSINIPTDNVVYPCIIHVEDGKYTEHAFQSPENSNAFNQLRMLLMNTKS